MLEDVYSDELRLPKTAILYILSCCDGAAQKTVSDSENTRVTLLVS